MRTNRNRRLQTAFAVLLVLLTVAAPAHGDTIAGRASVIDGDTIEIHGMRIRLLDIDAPESRQACTKNDGSEWACGRESALALSDKIGQQTVTCQSEKLDKYKRHLASCTVAGVDLAEWMAKNGWAVPFRGCECEVVRAATNAAKLANTGIWSSSFAMPWDWRQTQATTNFDVSQVSKIGPSSSWSYQLASLLQGDAKSHIVDILIGAATATFVLIAYWLYTTTPKGSFGNRGKISYLFRMRRFRWTRQSSSIVLLIVIGAFALNLERFTSEQKSPPDSSSTRGCDIKGNISASGERIYHVPGNRYYDRTTINESRGERWFCSEGEARAAGWRPAKV